MRLDKGMSNPAALIVIDVQNGFNSDRMPATNNPECENNVRRLLSAWREKNLPVVLVKHSSKNPNSVLAPGQEGFDLQPGIDGAHDLLVVKSVHSAFYGEPNLKEWLDARGITKIVICGIQTNMCCETTARMAGNLGYEVDFVVDAMRTFDGRLPDGSVITADEITRGTVASLHGEFATVTSTDAELDLVS